MVFRHKYEYFIPILVFSTKTMPYYHIYLLRQKNGSNFAEKVEKILIINY